MIARLIIDLLRTIHAARIGHKNEPFVAADIEMMLLSGAVLMGHVNGTPRNGTELARFLGVPRATVLRKLDDLQKRGLVVRRGNRYCMGELKKGEDDYVDKCLALIRRAQL